MSECRVCGGVVDEFFDFGRQPLSDVFCKEAAPSDEFFFRLAVGVCGSCTMVQLMEEVPRERMFHEDYPYRSSGSATMRGHFEKVAHTFLQTELTGPDPFIVEIGCNDGAMLRSIQEAGIRHLGVEPSGGVADVARAAGVQVRTAFFEESTAREIAAEHGPANVIYAANTICHIPYLGSIFAGVSALLADDGVFLFEDPYLGEIVKRASFDQIYDEHFYFFSAHSVRAAARRFGLELVDVERLPVHGGELRYTIARSGSRPVSAMVTEVLAEEAEQRLHDPATFQDLAARIRRNCQDLVTLLRELKDKGRRVVAYGATAKSATVANYCGIGPDLVSAVYDITPEKQGLYTPGMHIPVRPMEEFHTTYPDYTLLFAWNFADEILAKESGYRDSGGKWILYVPDVHVL
ncbi:methylation protein EvaC [Nonomuraea polychroma]|uniref:Methylation protein EvaC n=1 Tax=Nonomuraea polychroma TaxID=46176 RepID=A0A438LZE1_9ACTN|nr:class I SAM-dependent methyltransferase [Nonomuraea polychroma]RVX38771.1 methylation protein EvaC [Nonomuraea polychroma]